MARIIILLFCMLVASKSYASNSNQEEMKRFLRVAYCDILGVTRNETSGAEGDYFKKHLNELLSGSKTPAEIVSYLLSVKSTHDKNPLGSKCTESYSGQQTLSEKISALNNTYCNFLGVTRSSSDISFLKHLNNLYSGVESYSDIETHLTNWKICNQTVGSDKYPILGQSCSSSNSVTSSTTSSSSTTQCPYELNESVVSEKSSLEISTIVSSEIVFAPIGVKPFDDNWMKDTAFCAGGYSRDDNQLEISSEKYLQNEINKCVVNSLASDKSCFREELLFKKMAMDCNTKYYYDTSKEAGVNTESCINEVKTFINALLQQKQCERRITFNYHHSMDLDGMFTSPTYQGIQSSIHLDYLKASIENESYRKDDLAFLTCISQAAYSAERKLYLARIDLYSKMRTQCNIHPNVFYQCWTEKGGQDVCIEHFSHDARFNSQSIVKSFQEDYVQRAKDFKYVPRYFRATKDNPVISEGVSYWGFDYYFQLDNDGKLVWGFVYLPPHSAKKTPVYEKELKFNVKTREVLWNETATSNMTSVNTQKREDNCSDRFEYYRKDLIKQNQMYIAKLENEAYDIGCTSESEKDCDQIALVDLHLSEKLEEKKAELYGKFLDQLKTDPSCADSKLMASLVKVPVGEIFTTMNVSGTTHTKTECTDAGGSVVTENGIDICQFSGERCPLGWTQHANWSATSSVSESCSAPEINEKLSCLGKENIISIPGAKTTLTVPGHSWANKEVEQKVYYVHSSVFDRSQSYQMNPNLCSDSSGNTVVESSLAVPTVPSCKLFDSELIAQKDRAYNTMSIFKVKDKTGNVIYAMNYLHGSSYEFSDVMPSQKYVLQSKVTAIGCK